MPFDVILFFVYVFFSLILASFCAVEKKESRSPMLYAGITVSYLGYMMLYGCSIVYLGGILSIAALFFFVSPVPYYLLGWIFDAYGLLRLPRMKKRFEALEAAAACLHRRFVWFARILCFFYAGFLFVSCRYVDNHTLPHHFRARHFLILAVIWGASAYLRKPLISYYRQLYMEAVSGSD